VPQRDRSGLWFASARRVFSAARGSFGSLMGQIRVALGQALGRPENARSLEKDPPETKAIIRLM